MAARKFTQDDVEVIGLVAGLMLGGALLAYQAGGRLSPQGFAALQSLNLLAVAYLASDDASSVTGETIGVSGGLGMM